MSNSEEMIFDSAPADPDDAFWLEQGRKMLTESLAAVRSAAKALLTGIGVLQGIYLGILGVAGIASESGPALRHPLFVTPLLLWLISLYSALQVMMTREFNLLLHSPDDIREKSEQILKDKQRHLNWAFATLAVGLIAAFLLLVLSNHL